MTEELNKHLYQRYGGFADKRYRRIEFGRAIAVDQHRGGHLNQSIHCMIFVHVFDNNEIELIFAGNRPTDANVQRVERPLLRTKVTAVTPAALRQLGAAYRRIKVPADTKSWHFAKKEVAEDLERLAGILEGFLSP